MLWQNGGQWRTTPPTRPAVSSTMVGAISDRKELRWRIGLCDGVFFFSKMDNAPGSFVEPDFCVDSYVAFFARRVCHWRHVTTAESPWQNRFWCRWSQQEEQFCTSFAWTVLVSSRSEFLSGVRVSKCPRSRAWEVPRSSKVSLRSEFLNGWADRDG